MTTGPEPLPHERPLAAKVEALSGYGIPPGDIAVVLGVEVDELTSQYQAELQGGAIKANARVAESLFRKATGEGRESVTASIFWLKTRARWKESYVSEVALDVANPLADLMLQIAENGRRIQDH